MNSNLHIDVSRLILKGSPFPSVSIQELAEQIEAKKRCEKKLPTWFTTKNIYYPNKLNIEQTSSEITAQYKAELVSGKTLIDITGGFGVDSYFFSKYIDTITHCEIDTNLSSIAKYNAKQLKANNISFLTADGIEYLKNETQKYDWVYADPSRRNELKKKVFLLKDCLPNIPENLELFFKRSKNILIKTSPILDITNAIKELKFVKEVHIVAVENEVKELLFILEKDYKKTIQLKTVNIQKYNIQLFDFKLDNNLTSSYSLPEKYIYEPNVAVLKSGGFNEVSSQLKIDKLHKHSHLYTSKKLIDFPGRRFKIEHCIPYDKKQLKKLIPSKKANITTRNFPETVAQIRIKTKLKDGGDQYLFFTTNIYNKHIVLICEKV